MASPITSPMAALMAALMAGLIATMTPAMASASGPAPAPPLASLCGSDEPVRFSCRMARSGKMVSLCEGPRHLIYRFGSPGKVELTLPDPAAPSAPYLVHEQGGNAELKGVAFARGAYTYQLTHFLGGRPVTEELSISVLRNGSPATLLKCAAQPAPLGDLPALFEQLRAGGMRVVSQ
jgi:hypothetical protein